MSRAALIRQSDPLPSTITQVILVGPGYVPPTDHIIVKSETVKIGDHWDGTQIVSVANPGPPSPTPPTLDEIYDNTLLTQKVLRAVVLALNDGTLPIATNKTGPQLRAIIKARMPN